MGLGIMKILLLSVLLGLSAAAAFGSDDEVLLQSRSSYAVETPLNVSLKGLEMSEEDLIEEDVSLEVEEDSAEKRRGFFKRKVFKSIGKGFTSAGNAIANTATSAARGVSKVAQSAVNGIEDGWGDVKNAAVKVGNFVENDVAKTLRRSVNGVATVAKRAVNEAKQIDDKVKAGISKAKDKFGDLAEGLGSLAVAFADTLDDAFDDLKMSLKSAFDAMVNFLSSCFNIQKLTCYLLLPGCDCEAGSHASISGSKLKATCIVGLDSEFGKSFGFETGGNTDFLPDSSTEGWNKLAATDKTPSTKKGKVKDRALFRTEKLGSKLARAPSGSCSTSLDFAIDANLEFEPKIEVELDVSNGNTEVSVDISLSMDLNALIEAAGECQFTAQRRFPKKPINKVACSGPVCIAILVQAVAEFEVSGRIHGAVFAGVAADFSASSKITIDPFAGTAEGTLVSSGLGHEEGIKVVATAGGVMRIALGPNIVVWPMPGVPMHTTPMIEAEMRMFGAAEFETGTLLLNEEASNVSTMLQTHRNKLGFSADAKLSQSEDAAEAAPPGEVVFLQSDQDEDVEQGEGDVKSSHGLVDDSMDTEGLLLSNKILHSEVSLAQELESEEDAEQNSRHRRRRRRRTPTTTTTTTLTLPEYAEGLVIEKPDGSGVCGAFSFNVRGGADLFALGLPSALADGLSTSFFKDAIKQAVEDIGENIITAVDSFLGDCLGGIGFPLDQMKSIIRKVSSVAGGALASVIPDIDFKGLGGREVVAEELFCKQLVSVDSNGNCQDLGCSVKDFP